MSWHAELDGALERQTAKLATPISEAFKNAIDVHQIVTDWFNTHPYGTFTRQQAIDWAKTNIHIKTRLLIDPIKTIHATGWAYGVNFGQQAYARARLNLLKAPSIEDLKLAVNFDWTNWKPGDTAASMKATPPKGLGKLWQDKLFLSSVDRYGLTAINQMGIILADSLKLGTTSLDVTRNLVAADLQDLRDSGWRALRIARTELNRALNTATMDTYQTNGVEYVEWLADEEGDCKICPSFADLGAVPIGYQFDEDITEPPAHPNCRCTILPAFPQDQVAKMIQKFNENHDERGRFSSSNESGVSVTDARNADNLQLKPEIETQVKFIVSKADELNKLAYDYQYFSQSPLMSNTEPHLTALQDMLGINGKPEIVENREDLTGTLLYRGVKDPENKGYADAFRYNDKAWNGRGIYGNGTYFSTEASRASDYANYDEQPDFNFKNFIYASLKDDANIISFEKPREVEAFGQKLFDDLTNKIQTYIAEKNNIPISSVEHDQVAEHLMKLGIGDAGKFYVPEGAGGIFTLYGYDAYEIGKVTTTADEKYLVVLNRQALKVAK